MFLFPQPGLVAELNQNECIIKNPEGDLDSPETGVGENCTWKQE